jgi:hypothetical protein
MVTVGKNLADQIAAKDGYYLDDPRVMRIVEYTNALGGVSYGLEYAHQVGKYSDRKVYWEAKQEGKQCHDISTSALTCQCSNSKPEKRERKNGE